MGKQMPSAPAAPDPYKTAEARTAQHRDRHGQYLPGQRKRARSIRQCRLYLRHVRADP